ncbi:MAG: hypothetical protein M1521_06320, partial [Thermotogae bacterium]|nr:hypothetical protein [Thermotogota bacterium]
MEYILPGKKLQHVANPSFLFYKCISSKEYNSDSKDKFNNLKKIAGSLVSSYKFGNLDAYAAYKNRMESVADGLKEKAGFV